MFFSENSLFDWLLSDQISWKYWPGSSLSTRSVCSVLLFVTFCRKMLKTRVLQIWKYDRAIRHVPWLFWFLIEFASSPFRCSLEYLRWCSLTLALARLTEINKMIWILLLVTERNNIMWYFENKVKHIR